MQQVWRKRWRSTGWIALGATTLVLLISAISKKNHKTCNGIEVSFNKDGSNFFVDEKGIVAILKSFGNIKGEEIDRIDLRALEERIKSDRWIANAELFFDNKQFLQVIVEEKEPVARIFTVSGSSFYIDSACNKLQLSEKLSARIPMFTNFPSDRPRLSRPDSELLASAKELAMFIQSDDFWKSQVAQVDITTTGFEMIPTIGSHVVLLGKDGNWQQKFDRLFSFYKQVWTQVGFEKYEKLDVQYDRQVVATVKGARPVRVDSVKARMAYENLLAGVKTQVLDSNGAAVPVVQAGSATSKSAGSVLGGNTPATEVGSKTANNRTTTTVTARKVAVTRLPVAATVSRAVLKHGVATNKGGVQKVPKAIMKKPATVKAGQQKKR
jgi:cell division protein FtsQ